MPTLKGARLVLILILGAMTAQVASSADAPLSGTVKSSDGKLLEGAAVSARADGSTITTTVYSDQSGEYRFPPLDAGHYQMWAQAVGYQEKRADLEITPGEIATDKETQLGFSLALLHDFSAQLSGSGWLASLPAQTPEDRRMKTILRNNCADCHSANFVLQNRFDQNGWSKVLDLMTKITYWAEISEGAEGDELTGRGAVIAAYKEDLAAYLARVRGPTRRCNSNNLQN